MIMNMTFLAASGFEINWGMIQAGAMNLLVALLIFALGFWISGWVKRSIEGMARIKEIDATLVGFFSNIVRYLIVTVAVVAALSKLGVPTTSVVALLGAAGLAVGLALQNSLSNFAAGVMILLFRPFRGGDFIEAGGASGVVESIDLLTTILKTPDGKKVIVPNGSILGGVITNVTAYATRRVDWTFNISYEDEIDAARTIISNIFHADARILNEPAPTVDVSNLGDSAVELVVRAWVANEDWWPVNFEVRELVKKEFASKGITIPFPQRSIHLLKEAS